MLNRHPIFQRIVSRQHRSPRRHPERPHQFRRVGNLHLQFLPRRKRPGLQLLHILRRMHQQDVLVRRRTRRHEVLRLRHARLYQPLVDALVLLGREDVRADWKVVIVAVDELERQHAALSRQPLSGLDDETHLSYSAHSKRRDGFLKKAEHTTQWNSLI